jgi:hypothetical protein
MRLRFAELALGAVRAVEDDLRRLVVGVVGTPALLVGRQPAGLALRAARDQGEALAVPGWRRSVLLAGDAVPVAIKVRVVAHRAAVNQRAAPEICDRVTALRPIVRETPTHSVRESLVDDLAAPPSCGDRARSRWRRRDADDYRARRQQRAPTLDRKPHHCADLLSNQRRSIRQSLPNLIRAGKGHPQRRVRTGSRGSCRLGVQLARPAAQGATSPDLELLSRSASTTPAKGP